MSEDQKDEKKPAAKKAARQKDPVLFAVTVIKDHTKIGSMECLKGVKAKLPEDKAKALEGLGRVRIDGIA